MDGEIICMKEDIATIKNDLAWIKNLLISQSTDTDNKAKLLAMETERVRETFQGMYESLEDKYGVLKETQDRTDTIIKIMGGVLTTAVLYIMGRILGLVTIGADKL